MLKIFQEETRIKEHLQKSNNIIFGNLLKFQTFRCMLQNPTPKLVASFFSVAKEFLAVGTREVFPVLLRLFVFLNITEFHVLNQFCIINVYFPAESTFIVVCFLVAGLLLCFKKFVHLADVRFF